MAMDMISGRNGGYPCIAQLPELSSIPDSASPYPDHILRTAGKNGGYPSLLKLPELSKVVESSPPYPEYLMRCLGSSVNNGYPVIAPLGEISRMTFSRLYFADKPVRAMYLNGQYIASAYCNEERVLGIYYET